ncbi:phosphatase PAP2 family protein [Alkalicella caledoniensis]|uniref:Phosphatase PAP2 family protein n=1 Tax=Alkalicella caledoniensis TaxID=2731377 RepID=A0A7G9W3L8_ALKCA|nr:phosphatase PAP2 family protein [Alkalicella caledoniensis]QNO13280.1 phosphatase PAP2 family protein [Alkalicella caledoniensis]
MNIWGLFSDQVSYSFPSGHALKAMLLFGVLIYTIYHEMKSRKLKGFLITFLVIAITLVGVGQVIRDRHFASDIIGGYFAAVAWLTFCMAVNRKVFNYLWEKLPHRTRERFEQSLG